LRKDILPVLGKSAGISVSGDAIRKSYYKFSDGYYALDEAVKQDPNMQNDRNVTRSLLAARQALRALTEALKPYDWD